MKAKNFYFVMAVCAGLFASSNVANAQDVFVADGAATATEFTCDNNTHYFSNWRDNWFIEISAGGNQPFVERGNRNSESALPSVDGTRWTATYSVGFGRWISPYLGLRLKGAYGSLHWDNPLSPESCDARLGWSHSRHATVTFELMWDMFNSLGGVNANRVFSIIPFVGLGGDANWNFHDKNGNEPEGTNIRDYKYNQWKSVQWTLPVYAGLQFRFRLCKYVDFFAEARAGFYGDNWNNAAVGNAVDALVQAMGGFNFNIGGRGWNSFNECSYVSQIAALNGQVNDLRSQLVACGEKVAELEAQLPCPEVKPTECKNAPLMATVRFTINSAKILPTEEVNIYTMAEWLKANPNEKIVIAGYADKNTGTSDYNLKLSERRANAVKDVLVKTYGIDESRLNACAFGSDVQEYPAHNDWNRIVIFKQ